MTAPRLPELIRFGQRIAVRMKELELIDRSFTIAASAFVALLPAILLISGAFEPTGQTSVVATEIINRMGLDGIAADAVRVLLPRGQSRFYLIGLFITVYGAFSLSRRATRLYAAIWQVPVLRLPQQWRGLVWVAMQLIEVTAVAVLRDQARDARPLPKLLLFAGAIAVWFGVELLAQRLITLGRIPWNRLTVAAGLVALGRLLVAIWTVVYLARSLTQQAEQYGPVGVVFSIFTSLFVLIGAVMLATLLAAVLTERAPATEPAPAAAG
ncbi:membrane protein [Allocatelliglobosispora scoriae]|uniref:Membrane protein n=1 Tax=Allocatelliglobosispora scoriae TaxID=643052 RepID=A0A841BN47_9ACTN|nr:hypothetical protein [Allocatelliglobosispora scoriae]MBB5868172.1 membrane protein [Allocatelliglobosispora scoriae]